jgi:DNA-binding transcriptional LysR family regulator
MIRPPLVELATEVPPLSRTLGCVTNPRRTLSNAARAFREVLEEYADPAPAVSAPRSDGPPP